MKAKIIDKYILNPFTIFIKPEYFGSKLYTRVVELEDEFLVPLKTQDIVNQSCIYYLSSYKGRLEGTYHLIGKKHKAPIAVDPQTSLYFFPTTSPKRQDCIWVNALLVENPYHYATGITLLTSKNKKTYQLPVSTRIFANQYYRTSHLINLYTERANESEGKKRQLSSYTKLAAEKNEKYEPFSVKNKHFRPIF